MKDADDFYCDRHGLVKLDSWSQGRVVLLGDAAYCPSANTGKGTTSAVVGAYALAGEIGRHYGSSDRKDWSAGSSEADCEDGVAMALRAYEQTFMPFMSQVQKGVLEESGSSWNSMPSSAFGIGVLNLVVGVASFLKLDILGMRF